MGYEVCRSRVYGPDDAYCNGSGLSTLHSTLPEAERAYEDRVRQDVGYRAAVYLIDLSTDAVLRQSGPDRREVERAMLAAHRRRYRPLARPASLA